MKRLVFTCALALISTAVSAQTTTKAEIVSVKPADESPVVYTTREELEAKNAGKIEAMKDQIRAAGDDQEKVMYLKKELWRFENAIVASEK